MALRRQLEAMLAGGVFAITAPELPCRCPSGPHDRTYQIASYFKAAKRRSKVLVQDANAEVTSQAALFKKVWATNYHGLVEYRPPAPLHVGRRKDPIGAFRSAGGCAGERAQRPAAHAGWQHRGTGWPGEFERALVSGQLPRFRADRGQDVHVLGDSIQIAPAMPNSAHMANGPAKVAAVAIVAELSGWDLDPAPMLTNTCYSHVGTKKRDARGKRARWRGS